MFLLIVDDDPAPRGTVVMFCERFLPDARIEACASGKEALNVCDGTRPDLVITDINMPGMDGLELAERLRELHPDCRVAFMTGDPPEDFLGLRKPFRLSELEAVLREQGVLG